MPEQDGSWNSRIGEEPDNRAIPAEKNPGAERILKPTSLKIPNTQRINIAAIGVSPRRIPLVTGNKLARVNVRALGRPSVRFEACLYSAVVGRKGSAVPQVVQCRKDAAIVADIDDRAS